MSRVLDDADRFALNRSEVAMQIIDGEAVAIDVVTGKYHGLGAVACGVVNLLSLGADLGQVRAVLEARYPEALDRIAADLRGLVHQLLDHRILVPAGSAPPIAELPAVFEGLAYVPPELETYEDMAELMALDPPMPTVLDSPWNGEGWAGPDGPRPGSGPRQDLA